MRRAADNSSSERLGRKNAGKDAGIAGLEARSTVGGIVAARDESDG
jgi:hypothetical protein